MDKSVIINTHSHAFMLRETNIDEAMLTALNENIITIVPSSSPEDIFIVDKFIDALMDIKVENKTVKEYLDISEYTMSIIYTLEDKSFVSIGDFIGQLNQIIFAEIVFII